MIRRLVDADQPRILRIAADDRMVLKIAEAARKSDVLGAAHGLITQEQHFVQQQLSADFGEQAVIEGGVRTNDPGNFGPDGAGQWPNTHGELPRSHRWKKPELSAPH